MASVISPLVSGIAGAPSGTVEIFRTGTASLAAVYSDAEGVTTVTTHALDANGSIVRYVEERVDVVVKDINGATVRTFTAGSDARDARLENLGYTGPDATGAVVPGGRTTVDAALTSIFASLGATNGNVVVNGVTMTLSAALSGSAGLVFNVKNVYGAIGDGVTDDTAKIQAAINAADAAGGGIIYFPHGTYLCNSAVSAANATGKFFYLGEAASGTTIKQGTSGITLLSLGNSNENVLMNLAFAPSAAANTGTLIAVGSGARATFISCTFSALDGTTLAMTAASTSRANLIGCTVAQAGASSRIASGAGARVRFDTCDISTAGASLTSFSDSMTIVSLGCSWDLGSAIAAGTTVLFSGGTGTYEIIGGAVRTLFTSGTVTACTGGTLHFSGAFASTAGAVVAMAGSSATLYESACNFAGSGSFFPPADCGLGTPADGHSTTRGRSYTFDTSNGATYTPTSAYLVHEVTSNGAAITIANPVVSLPAGWPLIVVYKNTNGGAVTPTFGTAYTVPGGTAAIASGSSGVYYFIPKLASITNDLVCISTQAVQTVNGVVL